jgi:hypothetical protein
VFHSLAEAKIVIEGWRRHYNLSRPHSALGYRPPAPEVVLWPALPATRAVAPQAAHALTFNPDHPMGAGQGAKESGPVSLEPADLDRTRFDAMRLVVKRLLMEEFELAAPDDVAYLQFQASRIAGEIVYLLYALDGR